jgi:hypothetical protein
MKKIFFGLLVLSVAIACKKPPMSRTANTRSLGKVDPTARPYSNVPATLPGDQATTDNQGKTYRFIVSFFSVASGPDRDGMNTFEKWVSGYATEHKAKISAEKISWGREGEMDYCYSLDGLSKDDQSSFVSAAKTQLASIKQVNVFENEACKHQKRK